MLHLLLLLFPTDGMEVKEMGFLLKKPKWLTANDSFEDSITN